MNLRTLLVDAVAPRLSRSTSGGCLIVLLALLALAAPPARATVTVTNAPSFVVTMSDAASVRIGCNAGLVRVEVLGQSIADYSTPCAAVTSFTITGSPFVDTIDLSGINDTAFTAGPTVSIRGGLGADTLVGSALDDFLDWIPGDASDTIVGGPGFDTLQFTGAIIGEAFEILADGSGFDLTRNVGSVNVDLAGVESVVLGAGDGANTLVVADLTGVADLSLITYLGGPAADTVDASAQANPAVQLVLNGSLGLDVLEGGSGPDVLRGGDGNDLLDAGGGDDTFVWTPGDDNDTVDGGPGVDRLDFDGSNVSETFTISALAGGFTLFRSVAAVTITASRIETLDVQLIGGDDTIVTVPLVDTVQLFDGGGQTLADTLDVDALGGCVSLDPNTVDVSGYAEIRHGGFETVRVTNFCVSPEIFDDGFEDGTTAAWDAVVPG